MFEFLAKGELNSNKTAARTPFLSTTSAPRADPAGPADLPQLPGLRRHPEEKEHRAQARIEEQICTVAHIGISHLFDLSWYNLISNSRIPDPGCNYWTIIDFRRIPANSNWQKTFPKPIMFLTAQKAQGTESVVVLQYVIFSL